MKPLQWSHGGPKVRDRSQVRWSEELEKKQQKGNEWKNEERVESEGWNHRGEQVVWINVSGTALLRAHPQDTCSRKREKVTSTSLIPDQWTTTSKDLLTHKICHHLYTLSLFENDLTSLLTPEGQFRGMFSWLTVYNYCMNMIVWWTSYCYSQC